MHLKKTIPQHSLLNLIEKLLKKNELLSFEQFIAFFSFQIICETALDEYGSSNNNHILGFKRCHRVNFPLRYCSS
ncbi:hypothetical protein DERP_002109 [Dermatophagoides pteronyssinus]|uniref:Uncharacterized protein n=1 Tax=Dermatophagoides pteronyssinus TaxID=6956 RepID=A0ABQ8JGS4_DERPT|nr:hypothetical protein DERP_002109 [Dermatophagoides pteronyssinus]